MGRLAIWQFWEILALPAVKYPNGQREDAFEYLLPLATIREPPSSYRLSP